MKIKFIDLSAQYGLIKNEILEKFQNIIQNTSFVSDKYTAEFENDFSRYIGTDRCIAVSDGTSALYLALWSLGIGAGDEVILPVNTFIASAEAVSMLGASPIFIDVDERTYNIDVQKIEQKITIRTRAIIPVHLYGQCADMDSILAIAKKHNLFVVEDACQAHGAEYIGGRKAGSIGDCAAFSFYPGKNLGAWGEGGAITTSNAKLSEKSLLLRSHGSRVKYVHEIIGGNFRMDEFQGAVLSVKLKYLKAWNNLRRENASLYKELLKENNKVILPYVAAGNNPAWHLFVIRAQNRDGLIKYLSDNDIQTGIHYPTPLHLTGAYQYLGLGMGSYPVAEKIANEIVSLPMYAELPKEHVERVANAINEFYK